MWNIILFLFLSVACLGPSVTVGSRILISSPYGTKSYHNMYVPLATELANRGHNVTIITNYGSSELDKIENVRQIVMDKLVIDLSPYPNPFEALLSLRVLLKSARIGIKSMFDQSLVSAKVLYEDERIKDLMANDHFDLVMISITFNSGSYPLAWHFKAPLVMLTPNTIFPGVLAPLGEDEQPSYIPFFLSSFSNNMNLVQRTINTIVTHMWSYFIHKYHQSTIHSLVRQSAVPDCPPLHEIEKNISLLLTNTHAAINYPRPMPPVVVEVGGMHCRPAKPLPADLEDFVSNPEGFILFAVGSMLPMEEMPDILIEPFFKVFTKLPQRIVWQWKGKVRDDLPDNVLALSWLPQQDLLGHKNCKLFMTHGGLNSVQEAIYHKVPLLGFPFGTDQKLNMRRAINDGYARQILWKEVSEESLSEAIGDMLHNPSFTEASKKRFNLLHDQIETPLERAVFWTEYVMRHNGTEHLQLASRELSFYQRSLIDVYFVLLLSAILSIILMFFCLKFFLKKCCKRKAKFPADKNVKK